MSKAVNLKANYNTFKCTLILQSGYAVDFFDSKSLNTVLGLEKKIELHSESIFDLNCESQ